MSFSAYLPASIFFRPGSISLILPSHNPQEAADSFVQHCNQVLADHALPCSADQFAAAGGAEHASVEEDAAFVELLFCLGRVL